jgi:hypothetical protein
MDSNISSTLIRRQGRSFGPTPTLLALQDSKGHYAPSYRRPSFEGQGYSHPMEGDSRSLRQLHDSAANSSEDLELSLFRPLNTLAWNPG